MEENHVEEKVIVPKKKSNGYIIVIVLLGVLVLGLCGYIVYDKMNAKEEAPVKEETKEKDTKQEEDVITQKEAEAFLKELIFDNDPSELLIAENDRTIFINSIKYLVFSGKYTKDGDQYIISQKDIQDLAYRYYMRDSFDYITDDSNFVYDTDSQTYRSGLNFGLTGPYLPFERTITINDFDYHDGVATFTYVIKHIITDTEYLADPNDNVHTNTYYVKLARENNVLRVKELSKQ